ncbi:CHAT (predicted) [Pycnogonum litorale]
MSNDSHGQVQQESQVDLPKLPVPDLNQTFETYLCNLRPIVNATAYCRNKRLVEEFVKNEEKGPSLQKKLLELSKTVENWSYNFWSTDMYMRSNLPLPVHSNPGMTIQRQPFRGFDGQIRFAARLILMVLKEVTLHEQRRLPVETYTAQGKKLALCMEQYYRLFRSYRYPGIEHDCLHTFDKFFSHVIVACKNQFFVIDLDKDGVGETELVDVLYLISQQASHYKAAIPVGVLTTDTRRRWGRVRSRLATDSINRESLMLIETCLCIVCLDDPLPTMFNQNRSVRKFRDDSNMVVQMLHGGGSKYHGCNRWYDKTMQFIVGTDGVCGLCYEHSVAEGIAVINMMDRIVDGIKSMSTKVTSPRRRKSSSSVSKRVVRRLRWSPSDDLDMQIAHSIDHLDSLVQDLEFVVRRFDAYGKDFIKTCKMSPDCFIQLALQLTFFKVHRMLVATYESASIRRFRNGRVDVIRSATSEALEWIKVMCSQGDILDMEKRFLFEKAMRKQTEIMTKTIVGQGIDNHMIALREIARLEGVDVPHIYQDEAFQTFINFRLSTSQVSATVFPYLGYGPVVPDGYGCSYNIQSEYIIFNISAFNDDEDTCADFFASSLESSLLQMQEMFQKTDIVPVPNNGLD